MVNGGLGLPLAGASMLPRAIYAAACALVFIVYLLGWGGIKLWERKMGIGRKNNDDENKQKGSKFVQNATEGFDGFEMVVVGIWDAVDTLVGIHAQVLALESTL